MTQNSRGLLSGLFFVVVCFTYANNHYNQNQLDSFLKVELESGTTLWNPVDISNFQPGTFHTCWILPARFSSEDCHHNSFYIFSSESHCWLVTLSFSVFSAASLTPFIHLSSRERIYNRRWLHMLGSLQHLILVVCFVFLSHSHIRPPLLIHPPSLLLALVLFCLAPAHRPRVVIDKQVGVLYGGLSDWQWGRWKKIKPPGCALTAQQKKMFIVICLVFYLLLIFTCFAHLRMIPPKNKSFCREHPSFKHNFKEILWNKKKTNSTSICVKHQNVA